ncbi:MAG: hypothetical protein ABGY71_08175 [bacterium]|nr:hypothetical protein [Planctomycetota bacterium]HIL51122.1 hypothetical protein [Planctomycetota bacterium]
MNPRALQKPLGRLTLVLTILGGAWLWLHFEVLRLPANGCSPLARLAPGSLLWIDLKPKSIAPGDVLLFDIEGGRLALAEVEKTRDDSFWLVTDVSACPGANSAELGWIARTNIRGRMILATGNPPASATTGP